MVEGLSARRHKFFGLIWYLEEENSVLGAQWLIGRVLDSRPRGPRFEPHWRHCVVSLSMNLYIILT